MSEPGAREDGETEGGGVDSFTGADASQSGRRRFPEEPSRAAQEAQRYSLVALATVWPPCVKDIIDILERWTNEGADVALGTVVERVGSAPRDPGAALAVSSRREVAGGVTGGCVEPAVIREANEVLDGVPRTPRPLRARRRGRLRRRPHLRRAHRGRGVQARPAAGRPDRRGDAHGHAGRRHGQARRGAVRRAGDLPPRQPRRTAGALGRRAIAARGR